MNEYALGAICDRNRSAIGYGLMLGVVVAGYLVIRQYGNTLIAPRDIHPIAAKGVSQPGFTDLQHALIALVLVMASAQVFGVLFRLIRQPRVLGEIVAGILLGPSLLGHVAPKLSSVLLPQSVFPFLNIVSQLGIIFYMFLVGLDLDTATLRNRAQSLIAISHASIVVPFLLGAAVALMLYPALSTSDVNFTSFSLFLGVSMSVTAFPVLARIVADRKLQRTPLGVMALTCAAVDDVTAWCLLAFIVGFTESRSSGALAILVMVAAYLAAIVFVLRPIAVRFARIHGDKEHFTQSAMAAVLLAVLLSSLATEAIGIHAIFGAFAVGVVMPSTNAMARALKSKIEDFVTVLLLPAFFAFTGLRTQIGLVRGYQQWAMCGLIILVASAGKFGGSSLAARFTGLEWRDSAALGILMNTHGLMELIVLNIGLDLGVISPTLFAMLVLMALVTTFATAPILFVIASEQDPGAGIAIKPDVIRSTRSVDRSIATVARIAAATGDRTE